MKKIIMTILAILLITSIATIAWNPNPKYNSFEVIWNAINGLDERNESNEFKIEELEYKVELLSEDLPGESIFEYYLEFYIATELYSTSFNTMSGFHAETQIIEYQDGDDLTLKKRPGRTKFSNLIVSKTYDSSDTTLFDWYTEIIEGRVERKTVSLVVRGVGELEILRINLLQSWPAQYSLTGFDETSTGIVETLEITFENFEMQ